MALNVSAWSIRHPTPAIVFSMVTLMLGWMSFTKLPITYLPNADIPIISVVVADFGAAPAELEAQVTKPIEDAVSGVEGVDSIGSTITDGVSATTIMFSLESNTDRALNDVKDAVTRVRRDLPQNINEPLVQRVDVVGLPIVTYAAIAASKTPEQLSTYVDNVVIPALQGIHGVAEVDRIGGVQREILVSLDPDKLEAVGLTAVDVSHRLRGTIMNVAGGRAAIGGRDQAIRTLAGNNKLADLKGTMISLPQGGEVRLDDLGIVTDTIAEQTTFARLNGEPIAAVGIKRGKGASDVVVAQAVQNRIDELKMASGVDLKLIDSSVEFTRGHYDDAIETLFAGACLAVIVVFLFLRDWRTTLIAGISLPLSIFPAFWAMQLLGFSLNMVSLLAITLSTGVLVDDAIVEVENIERHIRMGKSPYQAAMEAADEIGLAVIAISLTIVAIFLPASFIPGVVGQFFKQFGVTVSVQVLFSLLAARFVTPMLAAYFMKPSHRPPAPLGRLLRGYTTLVTWSVRHYLVTVFAVFVGLALFAASIWSMGLLSTGVLPAEDASRSVLAIELPPGSKLSDTERTTEDIVARLHKRPEVKSVFVDGGRAPLSKTEVRFASLIINYIPKSQRSITQRELELEISRDLSNVPDIRSWFVDQQGQRALTEFITGPDSHTVDSVANALALQMQRIPLVSSITTTTSLERPELHVHPRSDLATRLGITTDSLAETIRVATIGDFGPALAKFDTGDRLVPIRVQLNDTARTDKRVLEQLRVPLPTGRGSVPLTAIADIELDQGPISITRYNRQRESVVSADLVGKATKGDALAKINKLEMMTGLPEGITVKGDSTQDDVISGFERAGIGGLMMVYAVLVLLFGSFLQPITILFSLPLSIVGAIVALLLTTGQLQLNIPVLIGFLMLMGIVTKNAIMLVDFAAESMHLGMQRDLAIVDAGQKRARPILMTTIAMVAGMTPAALAYGAGGEFRSPMAIAVIGGLIVSTLLSLVFVPAFMALMDDVGRLIWRYGRLILSPEKATTTPHK
jgi:multidrug efflux pump subunit AcrB